MFVCSNCNNPEHVHKYQTEVDNVYKYNDK